MATQKTGRLAGRTALITGASRGIGKAIALRYAEEGADLFLSATSEAKIAETKAEAEARGATVHLCAVDVSDRASVEAMFETALNAYDKLDAVVNNAGVYIGKPFIDYTPDDFDQVMKVNTYGVFNVMQLAIRHMLDVGYGKIVNIASTGGKWESPNQSAYNTSKHAVVGMSKCAALENAAKGITINSICPGFVETDMVTNVVEDAASKFGITKDEQMQSMLSRVPMGRILQPVEVAHLAVYLASSESDGMTGQTITISNGMRMG